jgi:hypothetical protein
MGEIRELSGRRTFARKRPNGECEIVHFPAAADPRPGALKEPGKDLVIIPEIYPPMRVECMTGAERAHLERIHESLSALIEQVKRFKVKLVRVQRNMYRASAVRQGSTEYVAKCMAADRIADALDATIARIQEELNKLPEMPR